EDDDVLHRFEQDGADEPWPVAGALGLRACLPLGMGSRPAREPGSDLHRVHGGRFYGSTRATREERDMAEEARLEQTPSGLAPADRGWFVVNVRDTAWTTTDD